MMAITVLGTLFLYVWLSFGVVWLVVRWAKKRGRGPVRWGIVAGLIMYHLVFWDFLPTLIVYKYYCATKAGFWVYKTPEQWKAENPGVAETLTWREMSADYKAPGVTFGYQLNERIVYVRKRTKNFLLPTGYSEFLLIDEKNNEVLVRQIGVWAGYGGGKDFIKFWTNFPSYNSNIKKFGKYETNYKKLGSKVK